MKNGKIEITKTIFSTYKAIYKKIHFEKHLQEIYLIFFDSLVKHHNQPFIYLFRL